MEQINDKAAPHEHELIFNTGDVIPVALTCKQANDLAENLQRQVHALTEELAAKVEVVRILKGSVKAGIQEMAKDSEHIKALRAAADDFRDRVLNQRHQFEEPCLDNDQTNAVLDAFDETIGAALASPAPVAEVVEPNEIPFTDSCIGCGKKFTEVKICCDRGCTVDGALHRKGLCEACCGCEPDTPVAEKQYDFEKLAQRLIDDPEYVKETARNHP